MSFVFYGIFTEEVNQKGWSFLMEPFWPSSTFQQAITSQKNYSLSQNVYICREAAHNNNVLSWTLWRCGYKRKKMKSFVLFSLWLTRDNKQHLQSKLLLLSGKCVALWPTFKTIRRISLYCQVCCDTELQLIYDVTEISCVWVDDDVHGRLSKPSF